MRPSLLFWPAVLAVAGLCALQVGVLRGEIHRADGIGYGCYAIALLGCAAACWSFVQAERGNLRVRWALFFAGLMMAVCCYGVAAVQNIGWLTPRFGQPYTVAFADLSEAFFLLTATMLFSAASRPIAILDTVQALLFASLRFCLTYAPRLKDHFAPNHLLITQLVAMFLFATAALASLGAVSRAERRLLRLLSLFLGLRLAGYLLADQVSYVWLHYQYASVWDMPLTLFFGGFAVFLMEEFRQPAEARRAKRADYRPSMATRNLMPSLLALANVSLGLCVLSRSLLFCVPSVVGALVFYALRTVLLQEQTARESALLQSRNEELETLVARDALTGAGNRRSLNAVYARRAKLPDPSAYTLLLADIDFFKQTNDRYGHLYGDKVLISVAAVLQKVASQVPGSHCARFGGDEFALLLPDVSATEALQLADEIRTGVASIPNALEQPVSVSVGGASTAAANLSLEELISHADKALYRAKLSGRNRSEMDLEGGVRGVHTVGRLSLQQVS